MTGLGNRAMLRAAGTEFSSKHAAAAIVMDLDGFKEVNDDFGHAAGDALLVEVADRLRGIVREPDLLIRLGGDEFGMLLHDVTQEQAEAIAQRITADICTTMMVEGCAVEVRASVGVATSSKPRATSLEHLLREADVAMYRTKHQARRRVAAAAPQTPQPICCPTRSR
jgi:diguanylate cyclase (GGDEF)-like protein